MLKYRFINASYLYSISKKADARYKLFHSTIAKLVASLTAANKELSLQMASNNTSILSHQKMATLLSKLSTQNLSLIKANKAYCANERSNFTRNRLRINNEIAIFKDIIKYFRNHYGRIHDFIRNKYNRN